MTRGICYKQKRRKDKIQNKSSLYSKREENKFHWPVYPGVW